MDDFTEGLMDFNDLGVWLKGLLAAVIGGAANSVAVMIADPQSFNFNDGAARLGIVAAVSAVFSAAFYLKQSPLPGVKL
jgi:hypothetical protein